jgi:signal transduction histidine kinase
LLIAPALAQSPAEITELEKKIAAAAPELRPPLLLELSDRLEPIDIERALGAAQQARDLATSPGGRLNAVAQQAALSRQRGDYAKAMELARSGLTEGEALPDDRLCARFHYVIARTEWSLGDYPASTASFREAIRLAEKVNDLALLCDAHTGFSTLYQTLKEPDRAAEELEQARQLAERLHDARRLGDYYKVLGNELAANGDRAKARAAHENSRRLHEQAGNERGVADALQNLAALATTPDELAAGEADCARAIAIYERLGLPRHRLNAERELGRLLVKLGRPKEAIDHLTISLQLGLALGGPQAAANAYRELAIAHEAVGDTRAALDAQRKFQTQNDAVLGEKSHQQVAVLNARYDADRRENEIALLRGEQARKQAELNAKNAELLASATELGRVKAVRLALGMGLAAVAVALGSFVQLQRMRLRAERRVLAETKVAKEKAEDADRMKTRFLGIATHDIRTPLGNIVNLAAELRAAPPSAEREENVDVITSEAQRVLCLVEELLTIAALETGKLELHTAPVDLAEVVHAAVDTLRWQAAAKRQVLSFVPPPSGAMVMVGDAHRLHQVLTNLVTNAIKFSPPGKTITVSVTRGDEALVLTVLDEGPGLAAGDAARLFTPFATLSAHPTAGESSHGLGLSIAHEIVRRHGGTIEVESQPGEGAAFIVKFPLGATPGA